MPEIFGRLTGHPPKISTAAVTPPTLHLPPAAGGRRSSYLPDFFAKCEKVKRIRPKAVGSSPLTPQNRKNPTHLMVYGILLVAGEGLEPTPTCLRWPEKIIVYAVAHSIFSTAAPAAASLHHPPGALRRRNKLFARLFRKMRKVKRIRPKVVGPSLLTPQNRKNPTHLMVYGILLACPSKKDADAFFEKTA